MSRQDVLGSRTTMTMRVVVVVVLAMCSLCWLPSTVQAWEWSDWASSSSSSADGSSSGSGSPNVAQGRAASDDNTLFLTYDQVAELRVRDLKRRLARTHGYAADELAKMIFKQELVQTLAFEEEKVRWQWQAGVQRALFWRGLLVAVVAVVVVMCWPVLQQGYEVAVLNLVVYTDRKKLEASRCWEFQTRWGMLGVLFMFVIDLLQAWLTVSMLLSWVMKPNQFFFPTPHIPVRPAQLLGGPAAQAFGGYGINVGSMVVTWGLRFAHAQLERWTGQALSAAMRAQKKRVSKKKKTASSSSSSDKHDTDATTTTTTERQARRAARRQARQEAAVAVPPPDLPPNYWTDPNTNDGNDETNHHPAFPTSRSHEEFMQQIQAEASALDELD